MYPQCPLPHHITALYVVAVASCVALFSHGVALVGADVLVYSMDYHEEPEIELKDAAARFGVSLPVEGLKVCERSHCRARNSRFICIHIIRLYTLI
jgi:hypothetical protein